MKLRALLIVAGRLEVHRRLGRRRRRRRGGRREGRERHLCRRRGRSGRRGARVLIQLELSKRNTDYTATVHLMFHIHLNESHTRNTLCHGTADMTFFEKEKRKTKEKIPDKSWEIHGAFYAYCVCCLS